MIKNIGSTDKIVRYIAGAAIIGAGVWFQSWWGAIGLLPIITAAIGWCPPYMPFGINTTGAADAEAGGDRVA